jgi:hypothetical protein
MLRRAQRCTRDEIGTDAAFRSAPATALARLAIEPDTPPALLAPLADLAILILR